MVAASAASVEDMTFPEAPDAAAVSAADGSLTDDVQYEDESMGTNGSPLTGTAAAAGSSALRSSIAEEAAAIVARAVASSGGSMREDDSGSSSSGDGAVGEEAGIRQQYSTSSFESYEDSRGGVAAGAGAGARFEDMAAVGGSVQQQQQQPLGGKAGKLEVGMGLNQDSKMVCAVEQLSGLYVPSRWVHDVCCCCCRVHG